MNEIFPRPAEYRQFEHIKDFDNSQTAGEKAAAQLKIINSCFDNFKRLDKQYKAEALEKRKLKG